MSDVKSHIENRTFDETEVRRQHLQPTPHDRVDLVDGLPHGHAQRFRFVGARDRAPVIVRQDDHRLPAQRGVEDPFAGGVEVVTVDQTEHGGELCGPS